MVNSNWWLLKVARWYSTVFDTIWFGNSWNCSAMKCGSLSDMICSSIPHQAKINLSSWSILCAITVFISITSGIIQSQMEQQKDLYRLLKRQWKRQWRSEQEISKLSVNAQEDTTSNNKRNSSNVNKKIYREKIFLIALWCPAFSNE